MSWMANSTDGMIAAYDLELATDSLDVPVNLNVRAQPRELTLSQ